MDSVQLHSLRQRAATFFLGMATAAVLRMFPPRVFIVILMGALLSFLYDYLKIKDSSRNRIRYCMLYGVVTSVLVIWLFPILVFGRPIESKISLSERVGNHWQFAQSDHVPLNGAVLRLTTDDGSCRLTPELVNRSHAMLHTVVVLRFPDEVIMEPPKFWRRTGLPETLQHYFANIAAPPMMTNTVDETLHFRFPRKEKYVVAYIITGAADGRGLNPIKGSFTIDLTQ